LRFVSSSGFAAAVATSRDASPANTPVSPSIGQGIEPFQMMVSAKEMPTVELVDYTFVFAH
jgi:hypothetical protein